ncbi:MAG: SDR family oxidoreductase [Myxococcales bacterium]|nr:SDR family oxidoreductase [Myxococcales bacterium]
MNGLLRPDLLAGRAALVTGGGSGIGLGIARSLAAHGARVALLGRRADRLVEAAACIERETGRTAIATPADVREPEAVAAAVRTCLERFGRLDVLVNAAAGNFLAPAAAISPNGFRAVMDIDARGTWHASRAVFDAWMRDHGGVILNVSATLHHGATPMQAHASAAKAAVDSLTRSLALEWGPFGVRVVGLAPGPVEDTEGLARLVPEPIRERFRRVIPMRRFGRIDEIATLATFLVSDAAALVTGTTLVADGGARLAGRTLGLES